MDTVPVEPDADIASSPTRAWWTRRWVQFAAVAAAGCTLGVMVGGSQTQASAEVLLAEKNRTISDLEGEVDTFQGELSVMKNQLDTAEVDREALFEANTDLEAELAKVKSATGVDLTKTIDDGTWTVGVDVKPGVYRTAEAVSSDCYWGIYRSGTNGEDIIANDIPGGGRPQVTLKSGQDFNSSRCGQWVKVG